jgi:hypothetical protein
VVFEDIAEFVFANKWTPVFGRTRNKRAARPAVGAIHGQSSARSQHPRR